ncbi:hypothetical protein [Mucilaginibacter gotjawali]|uniref:Uncharacterized protein n=2 Tax=Mucilaginibacter gotjawali TaxID=1550579 RepID=A0A0X8X5J5_9SPHI|nr:hypothetical protein [Mucilaginibacter gotjawali]MBB3056936.1 hypothetical protein [Mucilaginibacter gotjawali]BAU56016.1 hypothetical protein MgSA37_04208 [Mucilaginibacter gotjawali]
MTPLSSIKPLRVICLAFFSILAAGCSSQDATTCPDCKGNQSISATARFKILDKTSKQDLFFGKLAKYHLNQLKISHIVNGHPDTAQSIINIDSAKRVFSTSVLYENDLDTMVLQVANLKPDTLYLTTRLSNNCCSHVYVSSVTLLGKVIYSDLDVTTKINVIPKIISVLK